MKGPKFNIKIKIGKIMPSLALGSLLAAPISLINRNYTTSETKPLLDSNYRSRDLETLKELLTKFSNEGSWTKKDLQKLSSIPTSILTDFLKSQNMDGHPPMDFEAALRTISRICRFASKSPWPKRQYNKLSQVCAAQQQREPKQEKLLLEDSRSGRKARNAKPRRGRGGRSSIRRNRQSRRRSDLRSSL